MDSTQDAELGDPHIPQPHWTGTPDGVFDLSLSEFTNPSGKTNDTCQQKPGTDAGHLPGKGDAVNSLQTPRHPLSSSQTSINDDDTMDDMEAPATQHDDNHKPEDTPASSK